MTANLQRWQRSQIRKALERYRQSLDSGYYIHNKRQVETWGGLKAFSLLSPPLGSHAAQRRLRFIAKNIVNSESSALIGGLSVPQDRTPHFATLAVTYQCQCDCAHCSASRYRQQVARDGSALSVAELQDVIRQTVEMGTTCVILTGGEPLLLDGLVELIRPIDPALCICTLFTNGEYLTAETVRSLKEAGLFGVFVSLDSSDASEHDANRGRRGLFRTAVDGIRRCQEAGLLTGLSTYVSKTKLVGGELDAMMALGRELGVLEVFLFDLIAVGRLRNRRGCMLSSEERQATKRFQKRYNETLDYPRVIHQTMFASIAYPCAAHGCPAGIAQIHIRANGDVAPCDFTPFSFGNVRERPLRDIWNDITGHEIYSSGSPSCRLADPAYWEGLAAATAQKGPAPTARSAGRDGLRPRTDSCAPHGPGGVSTQNS